MEINKIQGFVEAINNEEKRIKDTMRGAGYYAYKVLFQPNSNNLPHLTIEARPWYESDDAEHMSLTDW